MVAWSNLHGSAFCLELGDREGLANCYSNWARQQHDSKTEGELERALAILTELKMPREIIAVDNNLDEAKSNGPGNWLPVSSIVAQTAAVILRKRVGQPIAFEVFSSSNVMSGIILLQRTGMDGDGE